MKHVILGVTGSIAAYKAADLANTLTKQGVSVHTIMTESACKLIRRQLNVFVLLKELNCFR